MKKANKKYIYYKIKAESKTYLAYSRAKKINL